MTRVAFVLALVTVGCGSDGAPVWQQEPLVLPMATANNAVAAVGSGSDCVVYSALGIGPGATGNDIHNQVFEIDVSAGTIKTLPALTSAPPRVAAAATAVAGNVYVLGGFTVSGSSEQSYDTVDIWDGSDWIQGPTMPVPVDDHVVLAWRDRYIVSVGGWSTVQSVRTIQILDTQTNQWIVANDFPGTPVFGHAGAIDGDQFVIVDGVGGSVLGFDIAKQAWLGTLNPDDIADIQWTELKRPKGPPRYRAAGGIGPDGLMWFYGGTSEPYNIDGLTYKSSSPATPLATALVFDVDAGEFEEIPFTDKPASMDHRGLVRCGDASYLVGGMTAGPIVDGGVWRVASQ